MGGVEGAVFRLLSGVLVVMRVEVLLGVLGRDRGVSMVTFSSSSNSINMDSRHSKAQWESQGLCRRICSIDGIFEGKVCDIGIHCHLASLLGRSYIGILSTIKRIAPSKFPERYFNIYCVKISIVQPENSGGYSFTLLREGG